MRQSLRRLRPSVERIHCPVGETHEPKRLLHASDEGLLSEDALRRGLIEEECQENEPHPESECENGKRRYDHRNSSHEDA